MIPKGGYDKVRQSGCRRFASRSRRSHRFCSDRLEDLADWDQIRLLTVAVDRLTQWHRPGLLCIGDAAHAMSPIGGVGINLAIQDAVATANILAGPLARRTVTEHDLAKVQRCRTFPTKFTQGLQVLIQNHVITRVLGSSGEHMPLPWPMKLLRDSRCYVASRRESLVWAFDPNTCARPRSGRPPRNRRASSSREMPST